MKIPVSFRPPAIFLFLLFPVWCMAQQPMLTANDSLKMDSMKNAFIKTDSARMDSIRKDTTWSTLVRTRFEKIYAGGDTAGQNGQRLAMRALRFGHVHFLDFKWKAAFLSQLQIDTGATMQVTFTDSTATVLKVNGAALPQSSGMRHDNSAEIVAEYVLARDDFRALRNKTVAAVIINYTGGQAVFNIGAAGAANIQKVCASVAEKRTTTAN